MHYYIKFNDFILLDILKIFVHENDLNPIKMLTPAPDTRRFLKNYKI